MNRREYPEVEEMDALRTEIVALEDDIEHWDDLYNTFCAAMNRVDMLKVYIEVLAKLANVRVEKLDEIVEMARAHSEFEKVMRGESTAHRGHDHD